MTSKDVYSGRSNLTRPTKRALPVNLKLESVQHGHGARVGAGLVHKTPIDGDGRVFGKVAKFTDSATGTANMSRSWATYSMWEKLLSLRCTSCGGKKYVRCQPASSITRKFTFTLTCSFKGKIRIADKE